MSDTSGFWEAVFEIRRHDARYAEEAYSFVMEALEYTVSSLPARRHVTGVELVGGLCQCAKDRFGLMAWTVLERWGIRETADVGTIVFQLIDGGVLHKQDSDSRTDFDDVADLQSVLEEHYFESVDDQFDAA